MWRNLRRREGAPMGDNQCDALVFFGATGDLAYKKIFPSLQAMIKRGALNIPIIGVAKNGWSLERLQERARDSLEHHGGIDTAAFARLMELLRYIDGGYRGSRDLQAAEEDAGRRRAPRALPRHSAGALRDRGRAPGGGGLRACGRASGRRKAVRPRPRSARALNRHLAQELRRRADLPHRPLSRQEPGTQHALFQVQQFAARACVEPAAYREHSAHHGRGLRHPGTGRVLRLGGYDPRCDSESPVPGVVESRHGASRTHRQRIHTRRKGEGAQVHACARTR